MRVREKIDFVMIYDELNTGGIETLILRSSRVLLQNGFRVWIFCKRGAAGGDLQRHFDSRAIVVNYGDTSELIEAAKTHREIGSGGNLVFVLSFDSTPAARSLLFELTLPRSVDVINVTGIFHPHAYFMPGQPADRVFLNSLVAKAFGDKAIFFMNRESRLSHASKWKTDLANSRVIPLPIDEIVPTWVSNRGKANAVRVISVGRLVDFKAYNRGAPNIVRLCRIEGIEIVWDIYGYGPEEDLIRRRIDALGLRDNVRLMGPLHYLDLPTRVSEYDLFVGFGTAALEAAMAGIPAICATVGEENKSYGFLHELPFGNIGEHVIDGNTKEIIDMIRCYSSLDDASRILLSRQSIAAARKYSNSAFVDSLLDLAKHLPSSTRRVRKRVVGMLFFQLTDGAFARHLLGRGIKAKIIRALKLF